MHVYIIKGLEQNIRSRDSQKHFIGVSLIEIPIGPHCDNVFPLLQAVEGIEQK